MMFPVTWFSQRVGDFLLTAMPATEIIRISRADPRKFDRVSMETEGGIQREPSRKRIKEIGEYARTVDAAFPTAVILSIHSHDCVIADGGISVAEDKVADIVDGQHRVLGLQESGNAADFVIPVVIMIDATEEQQALIFATINGKQTKVPASLIYDLFGVTKTRSPQKTCHEIARAMNSTPTSAWFNRLKMLGKKTVPGSSESLSQGTFVKFLLPLVSSKPDVDMDLLKRNKPLPVREKCIFNEYFRKDHDSTILKILLNVFQGARETWPVEWEKPDSYVLTKTLGFTGIMQALPEMYWKGKKDGDLSEKYFGSIFEAVKKDMSEHKISLTSDFFSASASGEADFRNLILSAVAHTAGNVTT
jgi:DGQHR domain-containing protein